MQVIPINRQAFERRKSSLASNAMPSLDYAFALVELLVVIAVVAILAAILIPVSGSIRATAQNVECVSNLRQIGVAMDMYAADNDYSLPERYEEGEQSDQAWSWKLAPYAGYEQNLMGVAPKPRSLGIFTCPAHDKYKVEARHASYAYNGYVRSIFWNYNDLIIPEPANTIVVVEIDRDVETFNPAGDTVAIRHPNDSANFLYADGHVETIPQADEIPSTDSRWRWW